MDQKGSGMHPEIGIDIYTLLICCCVVAKSCLTLYGL